MKSFTVALSAGMMSRMLEARKNNLKVGCRAKRAGVAQPFATLLVPVQVPASPLPTRAFGIPLADVSRVPKNLVHPCGVAARWCRLTHTTLFGDFTINQSRACKISESETSYESIFTRSDRPSLPSR